MLDLINRIINYGKLNTKIKLYLEANSKTWDDTKVNIEIIKMKWKLIILLGDYDGLAQPTARTNSSI